MTPVRMCAGCRTRRSTSDLVRLRLQSDAHERLAVDTDGSLPGRSVYLCREHPEECAARAHRSRSIIRGLRMMEGGIPLESVLSALSHARSKEE